MSLLPSPAPHAAPLNSGSLKPATDASTPEQLLARVARLSSMPPSEFRNSGFHAVARGNLAEARCALKAGLDPNASSDGSRSSLLMLAAHSGTAEVVEALLEAGALPNQLNAHNESALFYAVQFNGSPAATLALVSRVNPDLIDDAGNTALMMALECGAHADALAALAQVTDMALLNRAGETHEQLEERLWGESRRIVRHAFSQRRALSERDALLDSAPPGAPRVRPPRV